MITKFLVTLSSMAGAFLIGPHVTPESASLGVAFAIFAITAFVTGMTLLVEMVEDTL